MTCPKAGPRERLVQRRHQPGIELRHAINRGVVKQIQRDLARGHRDRIGREGAAPRQAGLALAMVVDPHELAPPRHRADGKAAADDLAQGSQIRLDAQQRLDAAGVTPERDDFIQDEKRPDLAGHAFNHIGEALGRLHEPQIAGHRVEQDGRDVRGIRPDDPLGGFNVVEGDDHHVVRHSFGHPFLNSRSSSDPRPSSTGKNPG